MPYIPEENHCTLQQIREKHGLSMEVIAAIANVHISKVWLLENSGYLSEQDVDKILTTLSHITGEVYIRNMIGGYWTGKAKEAFLVEFHYG